MVGDNVFNQFQPPSQMGWSCPKCGGAHPPHVWTCPVSHVTYPVYPSTSIVPPIGPSWTTQCNQGACGAQGLGSYGGTSAE